MNKKAESISILLQDGSVDGRIMCSLDYGINLIWKIPRAMLYESEKDIKELKNAGIYFLFGNSDEVDNPVFYVGQAGGRDLITRLKEHNKSKEYWTEAVILTTSDNSLGATDVTYLEHEFYKIAKDINRVNIQNKQEPNKGNVSKRDEIKGDKIIDDAKLFMHFLGYKVFESLSKEIKEDKENIKKQQEEHKETEKNTFEKKYVAEEDLKIRLYLSSSRDSSYNAVAEYRDGKYIVLKGSKIASEISSAVFTMVTNLRNKHSNKISKDFILLEDIEFTSPSTSAKFIVGYSINGRISWKNEEGKTVKELGL